MTYLLDVNALIAAVWTDHAAHKQTDTWLAGKAVAVCPLTELGFLRISTNPKALNVAMTDARKALESFYEGTRAERIPADVGGLESYAPKHAQLTDRYLADLAHKHRMKLATLDTGLKHHAVEVIP